MRVDKAGKFMAADDDVAPDIALELDPLIYILSPPIRKNFGAGHGC
jgi:hypothetical protein